MFCVIFAVRNNQIINHVYDLIYRQLARDPYIMLVNRIEAEFQPSETEQIHKLRSGLKCGD